MNTYDRYYQIIASIHGILGLVIFVTGAMQFLLRKGTKLHKNTGYIHFISWIGILITGAYLGSMVIVAIVLLGFYLNITGIRAAIIKNRPYTSTDKVIVAAAALIVLCMLWTAVMLVLEGKYVFATLSFFFSLLYSFVVGRDVLFYLYNKKTVFKTNYGNMGWYVNHLTRMQFSFITAVGAFTAVQNIFNNTILNFTVPAAVGFLIIRKSTAYLIHKSKIESRPTE
ncbi:MAG: hypothetical protein U0264_14300 [Candidatus Kapaibacterium sp.]